MLITLFATGGVISVPWMGSTIGNLIIALSYTGYKYVKSNNISIEKKFKELIKKK